jgi:antitoxin ParD1/3/4
VVQGKMEITLTAEQEAWLKARVASGDFASIEEAACQLIEERIAERELLSDDLAWAKPFVEEGLAALERGEFITLEEHKARNAVRLSAIKG